MNWLSGGLPGNLLSSSPDPKGYYQTFINWLSGGLFIKPRHLQFCIYKVTLPLLSPPLLREGELSMLEGLRPSKTPCYIHIRGFVSLLISFTPSPLFLPPDKRKIISIEG